MRVSDCVCVAVIPTANKDNHHDEDDDDNDKRRTHDSALARHVNSSLSVSMSTASGLKSSTSPPNGSRTMSTRLSERCEGCRAHNTRTRAVQQRVLTWYYKYPSNVVVLEL